MIIAGIDEAGYGPLLGPLVVSASAVEVPGELIHEPEAAPCLWRMLRGAVAKKNAGAKGRLLVADSKVIHNLTEGDRFLERGVLAFARAADGEGAMPGSLEELLARFGCTNHALESHPWYGGAKVGVPWLCEAGDLAIAGNVLASSLKAAGANVAAMRTAVLSEGVFNKLVDETNNKAAALISVTLAHLYWLHNTFGERGLMVTVDKQGGRDHYTSLLLRCFPEATLKVLHESAESSAYMLQEPGRTALRRTVMMFREKGETHCLPTALASMMCKYLRELCMHAFNGWWCGRVAGLQPTAGYYQDGMRWLMDVEPHLARLGVRREMLVRVK
jgi:hypothetical protein